jgi:predicted nucleic acid-binding protein
MRILIDTNIFIERETDAILSENLQRLMRLLNEIHASIVIHPLSHQEIEGNKDEKRKQVMLSKIKTYPLLDYPPNPDGDENYYQSLEISSQYRGKIDDSILYALFKNAVDYLITEDRGIHRKAAKLGLTDRVLLISEAIQDLAKFSIDDRILTTPALRVVPAHNLNFNDPIFDSLKQDYHPYFPQWFEKICREGRKCFVNYRDDGSLGAVLNYKFENEFIDSVPPLPKERRLKLSTFIVSHIGQRIGELFIRLAVEIAIQNRINEIYLTHFIKQEDRLVDLISEYGFKNVGLYKGKEPIFLKYLIAPSNASSHISPQKISKLYYPSFYDGDKQQKFLIPIQPSYHRRLFTDYRRRQTSISEYFGEFYTEGNSIKKVYITHSKIQKIKPGDLILFYRSQDIRGITSLGVVEEVCTNLSDLEQIAPLVTRRTVYSRAEIEKMKKPLTIILFTHHFHFTRSLGYKQLYESHILTGPPQAISELNDEKYKWIFERSGIDRRFTVH